MIIWIASYPKSGNTWIRSLISSYLYSKDGNFNFDLLNNIHQFPQKEYFTDYEDKFSKPISTSKYWLAAQNKINLKRKLIFLKTHNAMMRIDGNVFTNKINTLACIYIVRDPRNVITSIKNHFDYTYDESYQFMINERNILFHKNSNNFGDINFIGSWSKNYVSWKSINMFPIKIVRYEDLMTNTYSVFREIINFLIPLAPKLIKFDRSRMLKSIQSTGFEKMSNNEDKLGFDEAVISSKTKNKIKFFNLGEKNQWKNFLNDKQETKIRETFYEEMKELNYL